MFFRGILFTLCQLLGPEPVDVAIGSYQKQVLDVVTEMHFGLVTWFQRVSHDFAVFQEYFDPLDVVFLFHRVWSSTDLDRCPMLCLFNNRQVLLSSFLRGFCDHFCHWLPTADKRAHAVMAHFNDVAADFALVDFVFLCHSATSLSFRKLLDRSKPSIKIISPFAGILSSLVLSSNGPLWRARGFCDRSGIPSAAGFHPGDPLLAERAVICGPGLDGEANGAPDRILDEFGAAVDDACDAHDLAAAFTDNLRCLLRRLSGRDDIFADDAACAFGDNKATAQRHDTILTFHEDAGFTQLASQLIRNDDTAHGGPHDEVKGHRAELFGRDCQNAGRAVGVLQEPRTLDIAIAVSAGREQEVTFEQRPSFLEFVQNQFVSCHILLLRVLQFWYPRALLFKARGPLSRECYRRSRCWSDARLHSSVPGRPRCRAWWSV